MAQSVRVKGRGWRSTDDEDEVGSLGSPHHPLPCPTRLDGALLSLVSLPDHPSPRTNGPEPVPADVALLIAPADPGVFTGILSELGVRGVEVEELWGLDQDLLNDLRSVSHSLFRPTSSSSSSPVQVGPSLLTRCPPAQSALCARLPLQVGRARRPQHDGRQARGAGAASLLNNACASIALINATLNIRSPDVELGEELTNLQAFSEGASCFP